MRYALFGDVHGNLEAFRAVLSEIDALTPDAIYCLGDTIGYGPDPAACLDLLRERKIPAVAGNHDLAACGKIATDCFNADALRSVQWTHDALDRERLDYAAALPLSLVAGELILAHGTLAAPELFGYILSLQDAVLCFMAQKQPYAFVAHTHVPITFVLDGNEISFSAEAVVRVRASARAVVNVGSVGQPRDGNADAAFCLFDSDARSVEIRRVAYDVEACVSKIAAAGLPPSNGLRLRLGC